MIFMFSSIYGLAMIITITHMYHYIYICISSIYIYYIYIYYIYIIYILYIYILYIYIRVSSIDHDHHQSSFVGESQLSQRFRVKVTSTAFLQSIKGLAGRSSVVRAADLGSINGDTPNSLEGLLMFLSWKNPWKNQSKMDDFLGVSPF